MSGVVVTRRADLNPPLGKPGGPCHVVQRIVREVGSPGFKDQLVNKVEQGQSLSNPEASKVYEFDTEKTRGFVTKVYLGPHTQYRMDLRGVTARDLKDAIEEIGKAYHVARKSEDPRALKRFEAYLNGGKLEYVTSQGLEIVLAAERDGAQVVTVFWKGRPDPAPPGHCEPMVQRVAVRYLKR